MGKPAARISDMHTCPMVTPGLPPIPHVGGPIIGPGCPTVLIGGMPAAVMGDMCTCVGPPDTIVLGSAGVMIGGKPAARMGDSCAHGGAIVVGCPTVLIGEVNSGASSLPTSSSERKSVQEARKEFIEKYYDSAKEITEGTGIFPELLMSQMILESAKVTKNGSFPGESELSEKYNNFFGIKADSSWKGKTVTIPTTEYEQGEKIVVDAEFRVYESPEDSMKDHVGFLLSNKRYEKAGVFDADDVAEQAIAIQKAGYATDPNYAKLVTGISKVINKIISSEEQNNI